MSPIERYSMEVQDWAWWFNCCWLCRRQGQWPQTLAIHHFVRGASRHKNDLATTAILCRECHDSEHKGKSVGLEGMLALKRTYDRWHYDLARCNMLRGRAPTAITESDVDRAAAEMEEGIKKP